MDNYDETISNYIMALQEQGLEMNEQALDYEYVPIESYISLLDKYITMTTYYRDEVQRVEKYKSRINEIFDIFGINEKVK